MNARLPDPVRQTARILLQHEKPVGRSTRPADCCGVVRGTRSAVPVAVQEIAGAAVSMRSCGLSSTVHRTADPIIRILLRPSECQVCVLDQVLTDDEAVRLHSARAPGAIAKRRRG
jgi:hypothetical protein